MSREFVVAVVGATGLVGGEMIKVLEERDFPVKKLRPFASVRSKGKSISFKGSDIPVEVLDASDYRGVEIALFSAGGSISKNYAEKFVQESAVVIDNSSAFRMEEEVPLVVPEVNPQRALNHKGIIANPNCSTIQMVVALKPLYEISRIKRIVVSTYQAVSGTGKEAVDELKSQSMTVLQGKLPTPDIYPHVIAFNCLPHIDAFLENGYTREEMKMVNETRKIMEDEAIRITATTVRVPVFTGHSESVNVEFERKVSAEEAAAVLEKAPGVRVVDDADNSSYPLAIDAAGKDDCYVGRIRQDESCENALNMWIVSDNLRKGAALNAVQIAELLTSKQ